MSYSVMNVLIAVALGNTASCEGGGEEQQLRSMDGYSVDRRLIVAGVILWIETCTCIYSIIVSSMITGADLVH